MRFARVDRDDVIRRTDDKGDGIIWLFQSSDRPDACAESSHCGGGTYNFAFRYPAFSVLQTYSKKYTYFYISCSDIEATYVKAKSSKVGGIRDDARQDLTVTRP